MEPSARTRLEQKPDQQPSRTWAKSDCGLVLLDASLNPVAFNREAELILSYTTRPVIETRAGSPRLPSEVLEAISKEPPSASSTKEVSFRAGRRRYLCRAYSLEHNGAEHGSDLFALLLQRNSSSGEMIDAVAGRFNLTMREKQALGCISKGLSSKEMAECMGISPNTIKTYLRLIMVKMGVSTRGAIFAKVLEEARHMDLLGDACFKPNSTFHGGDRAPFGLRPNP